MATPASAPDIRGRFLWYELLTSDTEAAQRFYTEALGWGAQPFNAGGMPYTLWTRGGPDVPPVGGMMPLPDDAKAHGAPTNWLTYVGTPDVDATVERAKTLGARVFVPPTDIPDVGRFSVLADPQGAMFAVYKPGMPPGPETDPPIGDVSWRELATTDLEAGFGFYQNLFGWDNQQEMDMGPDGPYRMFGLNGRMYGGIWTKPASMPGPSNWLPYFHVEDVTAKVDAIKALGGTLLNGPLEVPGGDLIAQFLDPQGGAFAIHSKKK